MVLLDQTLSPWFVRSKVPELPLGHETSLVISTCSCVPDDISLHLWVGLELRWDTISQFGSIYTLSGPTTILRSPEHLVPQPLSHMPHIEGGENERSMGPVVPRSVKHAMPQPAPLAPPPLHWAQWEREARSQDCVWGHSMRATKQIVIFCNPSAW